ncbi:hypothetical protein ACOL24_03215 [Aliarcobacter butzleri]|uniref:hypothetical protein n=1 Tax=Aliarcobacter butzleri TaxID=28197 RepID=UPI003AFAD90E
MRNKNSRREFIKESQEMVDYCAKNNVLPEIQMIKAQEITQAWKNVEDRDDSFL